MKEKSRVVFQGLWLFSLFLCVCVSLSVVYVCVHTCISYADTPVVVTEVAGAARS